MKIEYTNDGYPFYVMEEGDKPTERTSLPIEPTAFDVFAKRTKQSVVNQGSKAEAGEGRKDFIIEPDLLSSQRGDYIPQGAKALDDNSLVWGDTNKPISVVRRPGVLPIAKTPDGYEWVMPKMLDLAGYVGSPMIAGKVPVKPGEMVLGSGAVRTMNETVNQPTFYSALERAVEQAKPTTATADQWLGYLRNQPGVKAEELQYVLKELPEGQITKQKLDEIVKQNAVKLDEKVLGDVTKGEKYKSLKNQGYSEEEIKKIMSYGFDTETATKYHQYQLPGGENYREVLMKLPSENKFDPSKVRFERKQQSTTQASVDLYYGDKKLGTFDDPPMLNKSTGLYDVKPDKYWTDVANRRFNGSAELGIKPLHGDYKASHFDDNGTNLLAHMRMNDRMIGDKKSLHLEEIQSDWHQAGRKTGYKLDPKEKAILEKNVEAVDNKLVNSKADDIMGHPDLEVALKTAVERKIVTQQEANDYMKFVKNENATTPDAPFKKTWHELALKRALREAVEKGYDRLSWTPGEAQAARYDLSKHVDKVNLVPYSSGNLTPKFRIDAFKDNKKIIEHFAKDENEVAAIVGKDVAKKLFETRNQHGASTLAGQDLKIGGEGMKGFYDQIIPKALEKIAGVKVKQGYLNEKNKVLHNKDEASALAIGAKPIHYIDITPEVKAKALKGFPLFSGGPNLVPILGNPFAPTEKKNYKLTPIVGNPFTGQ